MFVNPYGTRLPQIWREIMDSPILPEIIVEHSRLDPSRPDGWMVLLLGFVYAAVFVGTLERWPRATWLIPAVWFLLACSRIRHAPLFAITAGVAIADMFPCSAWAAWLARRRPDLVVLPSAAASRRDPGWALATLGIFVLGLWLQVLRVPLPIFGQGWARLDPEYWPVALLPELREAQGREARGTPIFNEYLFGGFLIYYTPGLEVFVDDRCELYGGEWLRDYVQGEWQDTGAHLKKWQRAYPPFSLALTQTGSGYDRYFTSSPNWQPIRQTTAATLYRRREASGVTMSD
jgi:hypothetical protein